MVHTICLDVILIASLSVSLCKDKKDIRTWSTMVKMLKYSKWWFSMIWMFNIMHFVTFILLAWKLGNWTSDYDMMTRPLIMTWWFIPSIVHVYIHSSHYREYRLYKPSFPLPCSNQIVWPRWRMCRSELMSTMTTWKQANNTLRLLYIAMMEPQ